RNAHRHVDRYFLHSALFPRRARHRGKGTPACGDTGPRCHRGGRMIALRPAALGGLLALGACTMGPRYRPETVIAPTQRVAAPTLSDSSRQFMDSLAVARQQDTAAAPRAVLDANAFAREQIASVAWLQVIRDTTLVSLVDRAVQQNRDVQIAIARIAE